MPQAVKPKNHKVRSVTPSNVKVKIVSLKWLRPLSPVVEGKKKPKPRELWQVEAEGLSAIEVPVIIPPVTARISDARVRAARVRELVTETALPILEKRLADYTR